MRSNTPRRWLVAVLASVLLFGCQMQQEKPTSAQIEVIGMKAKQAAHAERKLMAWAEQNCRWRSANWPCCTRRAPAARRCAKLFEQAARAAATRKPRSSWARCCASACRRTGGSRAVVCQAAQQQHARGADAGPALQERRRRARDDAQAAHWLAQPASWATRTPCSCCPTSTAKAWASRQTGPGPPLLEEAAEHEYPPAMQELAHDRATGRRPESRRMSYAPATS
jgi:hypothetical protein